jgi:4-alpha-glucanotransferase
LGPEAYRFVDWLAAAGQVYWQIMPLGPTGYGDSPYSSFSAFAGNMNLVSPEKMVESGLLNDSDIQTAPDAAPDSTPNRVDYGKVIEYKRELLEKAFVNFKAKLKTDDSLRDDYVGFLDVCVARRLRAVCGAQGRTQGRAVAQVGGRSRASRAGGD